MLFIATDELEVLATMARKGLNTLPESTPKPNLPFAGWECRSCKFPMKVSGTRNGTCHKCWSPELDEVYGTNILEAKINSYRHAKTLVRKQELNSRKKKC